MRHLLLFNQWHCTAQYIATSTHLLCNQHVCILEFSNYWFDFLFYTFILCSNNPFVS